MPIFIKLILIIPFVMFGCIFIGFIIASIWDLRNYFIRKNDIFYQLSRDHNRVVRKARK